VGAATGVVVAGLGSPDRADDAIGVLVASDLASGLSGDVASDVRVLTGPEPARLLDLAPGVRLLVVVDAVRTGGRPGAVLVRDLDPDRADPGADRSVSGHLLGVREVVGVLGSLGRAPGRVVLVGVQADCFGLGEPICAPVQRARAVAVRSVLELLGHR
jgi:hydrogenase maturation protease